MPSETKTGMMLYLLHKFKIVVVAFLQHPLAPPDTPVAVEEVVDTTEVVEDTSGAVEAVVVEDTTVLVVDTSVPAEAVVEDTWDLVEAVVVDTTVVVVDTSDVAVEVVDTSVPVEDTLVVVEFVDTMDFADNGTDQDKLDAVAAVFEPAVEGHSERSTEQDQVQHLFDTPSTTEHTLRMNEQIHSNYSRND